MCQELKDNYSTHTNVHVSVDAGKTVRGEIPGKRHNRALHLADSYCSISYMQREERQNIVSVALKMLQALIHTRHDIHWRVVQLKCINNVFCKQDKQNKGGLLQPHVSWTGLKKDPLQGKEIFVFYSVFQYHSPHRTAPYTWYQLQCTPRLYLHMNAST